MLLNKLLRTRITVTVYIPSKPLFIYTHWRKEHELVLLLALVEVETIVAAVEVVVVLYDRSSTFHSGTDITFLLYLSFRTSWPQFLLVLPKSYLV